MEFHERPEEDARKPINAWSETITESGKFRAALAERRCVVPGPAYYGWLAQRTGRKKPFAVARVGGDPVAFRDILEASRSSELRLDRLPHRSPRARTGGLLGSSTACR
jgi:putative SOS response-associated peptidase YedK